MLIKIQPDATVSRYLFTAKSLYMFRVSQHPSSGVLKTVTAASGTGHNTGTATSLQRGLIVYYRLLCVVVCDLETSGNRGPPPRGGGGGFRRLPLPSGCFISNVNNSCSLLGAVLLLSAETFEVRNPFNSSRENSSNNNKRILKTNELLAYG